MVLTVATWNIRGAVGGDLRPDPGRVAAVLADLGADLVALQEVDGLITGRAVLDLDAVLATAGLAPAAGLPAGRRGHGVSGNLLLARPHLAGAIRAVLRLPGPGRRVALAARVRVAGRPVEIVATHLALGAGTRRRQAAAIAARLEAAGCPFVVLGDLNEWRAAGASLDPLRRIEGVAEAFGRSFPSRRPLLPLDRVIAGGGARIAGAAVEDGPRARRASDHLPLVARIEGL